MAATSSMATSLESARLEGLLDEHAQAVPSPRPRDPMMTWPRPNALRL